MRSGRSFWRNSCAFAAAGLVLAGLHPAAHAAATPDFATGVTLRLPPFPLFSAANDTASSTSILVAAAADLPAGNPATANPATANPATANPATGNPASNAAPRPRTTGESPDSDLLNLADDLDNLQAPAWVIVPHVGIAETFTDNVNRRKTNRQADLYTELSAGVSVSADTPRIRGLLSYTASLRLSAAGKGRNSVGQDGLANAHMTLVPDMFFLDLTGNAREYVREGYSLSNTALLTGSDTTQAYTLTASPDFKSRVGTIGFLELRYVYGLSVFDRNTGAFAVPGGVLSPLSDTTQQQAQADFRMPGTIDARLTSDLSVRASESTAGRLIGALRRASGAVNNEFQVTRSFSAITEVGYETLSNKTYARLTGQGISWNIGGRWQPNPDSSFLLLYGRRDLNNDAVAQVQWRVTPATIFLASYTDAIATAQQGLSGGRLGSFFGQDSFSSGFGFGNNPIGGNLGDAGGIGLSNLGFNNGIPLQNDIFQQKLLSATLSSDSFFGQNVGLTVYNSRRTSLTGQSPGLLNTDGVRAIWNPLITQAIVGRVEIGYGRDGLNQGETYDLALSARYTISSTISALVRYDFIRRDTVFPSSGFIVNALTLRLQKSF